MGLRSGEYGGRNQRRATAALIATRTTLDLWLPRLSMTSISPGSRLGTSCWRTMDRKNSTLIGHCKTQCAVNRLRRLDEQSAGDIFVNTVRYRISPDE